MSNSSSPIAVIGAGVWGSALATLLARNGNAVKIWGITPPCFEDKPENITICDTLKSCLQDVGDVLIVVPSHAFRQVLQDIKIFNTHPNIVWATKGLDPETCQLLHEVVEEIFPDIHYAVISGPSFAKEVADNIPTAVSVAGNNIDFVNDVVERFHNNHFRVYANDDLKGIQLCGAVKNVLAIAVGMADGLKFGANTRAALITRGLAEMSRLCEAVGADPKTLMSLAGVGDLVLTCTDNQSRNRRFGLLVGEGCSVQDAKDKIGQAVEGLDNVSQVHRLAQQYDLQMPITEQVNNILYNGCDARVAVKELLERTPKSE